MCLYLFYSLDLGYSSTQAIFWVMVFMNTLYYKVVQFNHIILYPNHLLLSIYIFLVSFHLRFIFLNHHHIFQKHIHNIIHLPWDNIRHLLLIIKHMLINLIFI